MNQYKIKTLHLEISYIYIYFSANKNVSFIKMRYILFGIQLWHVLINY